jgi:hypothetical protein
MAVRTVTARRGVARPWTRWGIADAWVAIAALLPFVATALGSTPADDLAYQVRAGDLMLRSHTLLRVDPFTYTVHGHAWLNQQWGSAVVLAVLHGVGGWTAIALVRAALDAATFRIVYLLALRRSGDRVLSARLAVVGFVTAALTPGALAARAQLFALPLFAVSCWLVTERDRHPRRVWLLPFVTIAWANLHGSFFLPALLLACAVVGDAVSSRSLPFRRIAVLAACVAAGGVGPFGFRVYGYVLSLRSNAVVTSAIAEWRPVAARSPAGIVFLASLAAVGIAIARRRLRLPITDAIVLVVLAALGILTSRSIVWWAIAAPPIVAAAAGTKERERPASAIRRDPVAVALIGALVALSSGAGVHAATVGRGFVSDAPPGITRFLADRVPPDDRIFDGWWGSWFEYALPARPMFVDARAELFPPRVWHDYFAISHAAPVWQRRLAAWNIDVVVASPDHQAALIAAMRSSGGWRQAYADADGFVFVRV